MTREPYCAFNGFGQWDCDDAPCEYAGAFAVRPIGHEITTHICVRHIGFYLAADCALAEEQIGRPMTMVSVERVL